MPGSAIVDWLLYYCKLEDRRKAWKCGVQFFFLDFKKTIQKPLRLLLLNDFLFRLVRYYLRRGLIMPEK